MRPISDRSTTLAILGVILAGMLAATSAAAQSRSARGPAEDRRLSVQAGLGFTADPDAFLLEFEGDYRLGQGLSVGALLQLGLDDDFTLVSPAGYLRYSFDLSHLGSELGRVTPYVQAGLGLTHIEIDGPVVGDDDDTGFLMNFGFGVEAPLTDSVSLGSKMLFNFLPDEVFGESFYFSWQVAGIRVRF